MKITLGGSEIIAAPAKMLWAGLNDPAVLTKCIPGCKSMVETAPDSYAVEMQLRVAAVGGSFEGRVALSDKEPPGRCRIAVSGGGTLGQGEGVAQFQITPQGDGQSLLTYEGEGEIGGLVAGVGQRVLGSVTKHLVGRFFTDLRKHFAANV